MLSHEIGRRIVVILRPGGQDASYASATYASDTRVLYAEQVDIRQALSHPKAKATHCCNPVASIKSTQWIFISAEVFSETWQWRKISFRSCRVCVCGE